MDDWVASIPLNQKQCYDAHFHTFTQYASIKCLICTGQCFYFCLMQEFPRGVSPRMDCLPNFTEHWSLAQKFTGVLAAHGDFFSPHLGQHSVSSDFLILANLIGENWRDRLCLHVLVSYSNILFWELSISIFCPFSIGFPVSLLLLLCIWSCFLCTLDIWHLLVLDTGNIFFPSLSPFNGLCLDFLYWTEIQWCM